VHFRSDFMIKFDFYTNYPKLTLVMFKEPNFRFYYLTAFFLLGSFASVFSQNITVSEPLTIRSDYGYELIGRMRDKILLFRDKYDDFEIQAYDNRLQFAWNKELEDIEKRGTQIIGVFASKNDFSVVYKTKKKGTTSLRVHKYDPAANLIDTMTVKKYGDRMFDNPSLEYVKSEDKNCFVIYNTSKGSEINAVCFRLDKMQLLWDKTVLLDNNDYESKVKDMVLSNQGDFCMVAEENNKRSKIEDHHLQIYCFGNRYEGSMRVSMPEFLTTDIKFIFDNQNNRLVGAGLYSEKSQERANGTFYFSKDLSSEITDVKYTPFDDQFISILRGKEVVDDTKGISDANIPQIALRKDGGIVLVCELMTEIVRGVSTNRNVLRESGARVIVDHYYNDIFAIALNPNGKHHWKTVLHKKQYSQDDDATFSSFFMLKMADKLRFLFNDEIKYENTCSEYTVTPLGEFDRNSLLNTEDQNLRMRFKDGIQLNATECLIPSEYRNKLKLVLVKY
jgi:hypothetical protein